MLDERQINIIVRAIMPKLYQLQGFHDQYTGYLKQQQERRPRAEHFATKDGTEWSRE